METIQVTATMRIRNGALERFKEVAAACVETVRTQDTGTLQYDWFLDADEKVCVVRETYPDSDAVLEHIAHQGEGLDELFGLCDDVQIDVFGNPSPTLVESTADAAPRYYAPFVSL